MPLPSSFRGLPRFFGVAACLLLDPGACLCLGWSPAEALLPERAAALPFLAAFLTAFAASSSTASSRVMSRGSRSCNKKCCQGCAGMHGTHSILHRSLCIHVSGTLQLFWQQPQRHAFAAS